MNVSQRKTSIIILATLVLVASLTSTNIVKANSLQITTSNKYLVAGQENSITINLRNVGDREVVGVQAVLVSTTPGIVILDGSQNIFNIIDDGQTKSFSPVIYVDKSVPLGSYTLSLTLAYQKMTFEFVTSTVSIGVVVSEAYTPKLTLKLDQENIKATTGTTVQPNYVFENVADGKLKNIEFIISSSTPFLKVKGGDIVREDQLSVGNNVTLSPVVGVLDGTPLSTYNLITSVTFEDDSGKKYFETYNLPVTVDTAKIPTTTVIAIESIEIVPESVHPGETFTLKLNIGCSKAGAYDLMGTINFMQMSPISSLSPSTVNLGDLETDESTQLTYRLLVAGSASAGEYPVTVTIGYTSNNGVPKMLTETVTVLVDGLIDFDLLDAPSEYASPGETREMEADLLLIGTESVDFVSVGITEDDVVKRVSGSDEYIGAVDPDSPIPFDLKYRIDESAPKGDHELTLTVKYRDHLNREHQEQVKLSIEIGDPINDEPQPQQTGFWVWIRRLFGLGP